MKELSPIERCRKNGWKKGTRIRRAAMEWGVHKEEDYKITGFGRYEVLGVRVNLPPKTTISEEIIPIGLGPWTWRKIK
jgi:hypothetical protein